MSHRHSSSRPLVGITADIIPVNGIDRALAATGYVDAVVRAGGTPITLPPTVEVALDQLEACDALVLTGGDDPNTERFGEPTDPRVTPVHDARQAAESAMLEFINHDRPDLPVLGVCLGMQMMALHAGGTLDQWMADTTPGHEAHWNRDHGVDCEHSLAGCSGTVHSKHRQAIKDPGSMRVCGLAPDGIIEAIDDPDRRFFLGVQWHPERTEFETLGLDLFRRMVRAAER